MVPTLNTNLFELDGNALNNSAVAGDDWDNVLLGNGGASLVNTGVVQDPEGHSLFTQGSKDILDLNQWHFTDQSAPDKDEITNAYAAAYDDAGNLTLYFGADREAQNGDSAMGFWFFQNNVTAANGNFSGLHEVGDIFVIANFSKGGGQQDVFVYEWVGSGGSDGALNLLASGGSSGGTDNAKAIVNTGNETAPWPYKPKQGANGVFPKGAFEEGGVNLGALGIVGCFSSFLAETRSSTSLTAELKDFVLHSFDLCDVQVTKTGDTLGKIHPEQPHPIDYTVTVENTGAIKLYPKTIHDTLIGDIPAGNFTESIKDDNILQVGEVWTYNYQYTATDSDPFPVLPNTFSVVFTHDADLVGDEVSDSASHSVNLFKPGIDLTKTANKTLLTVGDPVTYTYTVQNTGTAFSPPLENVVVKDDNGTPGNTADDVTLTLKSGDTNGDGKLDRSETWLYEYTRAVVASDITSSYSLTNTAKATAKVAAVLSQGFEGGNTLEDQASFVIKLYVPKFSVVVSGDTLGKVTDPADYKYVVTNLSEGFAPDLTNPSLTDDVMGNLLGTLTPPAQLISSNADAALSKGEVWTINVRRVVQAADPDPLLNKVTASFQVSNGEGDTHTLSPDSATSVLTHSLNLIQPNFGITKDAPAVPPGTPVNVGQKVTYEIIITDTSSSDSTGLKLFDPDGAGPKTAIDDSKIGPLDPNAFVESKIDDNILQPGEVWTGHFDYVVTAADVPSFTNTVTARFQIVQDLAQGFDGTNTYEKSASKSLAVGVPHIEISKTRGDGVPETIHEGDKAAFKITISNTGDGNATGVVATDTLTNGGVGLIWAVDPVLTTDPSKVTLSNVAGGQLMTANIGLLLPGKSFTIVVSADTTGIFDEHEGPGDSTGLGGLANVFEFDDNNAVNNGKAHDDWANIFNGTDVADATTGIVQDNIPSDKTFFTQGGSKDVRDVSDWKSTTTDVAPDKNDIQQAFAAVYTLDTDNNATTPKTQFLTFGATKFDASGANQIGFWFFKSVVSIDPATGNFNGVHSVGDILVLTDFSQGGRNAQVKVYKWVGAGGSDGPLDLVADVGNPNAVAVVNDTTTETSPWPYTDKDGRHNFAPDTFFEGAINTSALGLSGCFNTFLAESRSSGLSLTAQLKDFVLGNLNECRIEIPNVAKVQWDQNSGPDNDHDGKPDPLVTVETRIIVVG